MNETNELAEARALFDDPPAPTPEVIAAARARLTEGDPVRSHRTRRLRVERRTAWLTTFALGLAGTVTAAAVTIAMVDHRGVREPHGHPSARALLLAAAQRAEAASPATGRYWHLTIRGDELIQVGKPGHATYQVYAPTRSEIWMSADGHGPTWEKSQDLGAKPATKADWDTWRDEGAPTTFRGTDTGDEISSKPGRSHIDRIKPGYEDLFGQRLTPQDVQALPADPGRLKMTLTRLIRRQSSRVTDEQLFTWSSTVLSYSPASPKVRAATYRMLAGLPGVKKLGTVTDQAGRTGTAVTINAGIDDQASTYGTRLIIDPSTGRALATETVMTGEGGSAPGTAGLEQVAMSNVILRTGWTNKAPSGR
ncbi:CU044_5270 family protein [Actinomadura sp. DC4]|uniref:CU044_5270 family protein n=1 Tax=Actinomadura sp. DC4 TaxID=3055069 RepID=UPI0025AEF18E|nr:CU044_5270 family protein [Actinomadura sp. DC4]MDN3355618.1 CU044_5270 family protein [Actinomadura sp. DC4]